MPFFRKRGGPDSRPRRDENPYIGLREAVLGAVRAEMVTRSERHSTVGGVIVDIPKGNVAVTVVALADGTTSMYTSVGGGIIGAGQHTQVAAAAHHLLDVAEAQLPLFTGRPDDSQPPAGSVRFHVLGFDDPCTLDIPEPAFWGKQPHAIVPTIAATQDLISAMRSVDPGL